MSQSDEVLTLGAKVGVRYHAHEKCQIGDEFYAFTRKELLSFAAALQSREREGWVLDEHSAGRLADYMMRRGGPCQSYNREGALAKACEFLRAAAPTGGSES